MADKLKKKYRLSKIFKRAMALFIIVIINFNSYAAVVSSNDGSAFITKAEFDALVNDFNSRIEDYEKSIDAKIDGAIAEYLAGLATASSYIMEDLIKIAKENNSNNLKFFRWKAPRAVMHTNDVSAAFYISDSCGCSTTEAGRRGYVIMNNSAAYNGSISYVRYTNFEGNTTGYTSSYYYATFPFGTYDSTNNLVTGNTYDWYLNSINRYRLHYDLTVSGPNFFGWPGTTFTGTISANHPTEVLVDFSTGNTAYQPGSKSANAITNWLNKNWPAAHTITHTWTKQADDTANSFLDYNFATQIEGGTYAVADAYKDYYSSEQQKTVPIQKDQPDSSTSNGALSGVQYAIRNYESATDTTGTDVLRRTYNNLTFKWKYNGTKVYNLNWANLVNSFYSTYFNTPYYKYYGIPICKPNKMTGDITFKLKFSNTQVSSVYPAFTYQINDVKFSNGDLPSASNVLYNETVPQGNSSYTKEITITKDTVKDTTNGDYLYIKIQPSVANQIVSVDTEGDILITIEA